MIYLTKDQPWPKTLVKQKAFGSEEEVDTSFKAVFTQAKHNFISKNGESPTHMVLGNTAMDHLKTDIESCAPLFVHDHDKLTYCGVEVLYSHRTGMEMLWGGWP
jgi:hypothetical protein